MDIKSRFPDSFTYYFVVGVLVWIFIRAGGDWLYGSIMSDIIDKNVKENNFKQGYICFFDYKPHGGKTGFSTNKSYYFYIDGKKSKNKMRPYFPFREQWDVFIKNMDRQQCYKAKYVEAKFLFFTQRRIYQVFEQKIPSPYLK